MIEILAANDNDLEALASLFNLYRQFYKQEDNINGCRAYIKERLNHQDAKIFIAYVEKDGHRQASGFTQIYFSFSSIAMQKSHILNDLFITQGQRQKGIAKGLMQAAADFAKQDQAKGLILSTARDNIPAQSLYKHLGYIRDENYYQYYLPLDK